MNTVTTSYKHNGGAGVYPQRVLWRTRLTARLYEYPSGHSCRGALLLYGLPFHPVCFPAKKTEGASGTI
ncbi:MAG: hypothetical protein ACLTXL_16375 [Clostridia bacterium]